MFSCPQSINMCFTKRTQISSCPPRCFYCCFELLPSGRFLWWESVHFKTIPFRTAWHLAVLSGVTRPAIRHPPLPTHTLNTWNVPSCLLHSTEWCTCLSSSWWRMHCADKSFAVMLQVSVIESGAYIMGCSVHGCMGSVFGLCDNGNNGIQISF